MAGVKKGITHPRPELRAACEGLSKAALIDMIGDFMDCQDPDWRVADLIEFIGPRLSMRGDREPKTWSSLRPRPRPPTLPVRRDG